MNLRMRITVATTVVVALVALASALAIWSTVRSELRGTVESQLREITSTEGRGRRDQPVFGEPDSGPGFGGARGFVQFVDASGQVRRSNGDGGGDTLPVDRSVKGIAEHGSGSSLRDVHVDHTHLLVLATGVSGGGAVLVARPLDEADRVLRRTATALAIISLIGIVLASFVGRLLAGVALRPVATFASQTEAIASSTDARRRIDAHGTDEVARLASSFNATLDELERSMDAQRQLIADAGHELRTPIASVRANVQVLEDADRLAPEDLAALRGDIVSELDELTELLADVIELARGSDPDAPQDDVRLDEVARATADRATRRGDSDVRFELDVEPTVVRGDAARIGRAVTNVIDNARKWSPPGGLVEVSVRDGRMLVRDHGPGIPEADLPFIFGRFYRSDTARSMPGSGLGLAIVLQTVQAHGGTVVAANDPDGGAVFELTFGPATGTA